MKRVLLGTSALIGGAVLTGQAWAAEPIKLSVGGYFKEAYQMVFDDDDVETDAGFDHNFDGFFNDAEIHFKGSTVLDNGLEVGARVELEGETENAEGGDSIDEAWIYFAGGFGEVRIGSDDDALANSCIVPPGGTGNFSAFSPNQWGANGSGLAGFAGAFSSNSVCTGVDRRGDAQKILYITPNFSGFQLTVSYTPNEDQETHNDGAGPHLGMPEHFDTQSRHNVSAYATYSYDGEGWGMTAGLGGSFEGHSEDGNGIDAEVNEQDFYQAGLNFTFGNFGIGIVGAYYNDIFTVIDDDGDGEESDSWVAGIGASYAMDAWTFGLQYSHQDRDVNFYGSGGCCESFSVTQDRVVATAQYALGPGILLDAEIGYTWLDTDPEFENVGFGGVGGITVGEGTDDYDAVEIGIGTNITF